MLVLVAHVKRFKSEEDLGTDDSLSIRNIYRVFNDRVCGGISD